MEIKIGLPTYIYETGNRDNDDEDTSCNSFLNIQPNVSDAVGVDIQAARTYCQSATVLPTANTARKWIWLSLSAITSLVIILWMSLNNGENKAKQLHSHLQIIEMKPIRR